MSTEDVLMLNPRMTERKTLKMGPNHPFDDHHMYRKAMETAGKITIAFIKQKAYREGGGAACVEVADALEATGLEGRFQTRAIANEDRYNFWFASLVMTKTLLQDFDDKRGEGDFWRYRWTARADGGFQISFDVNWGGHQFDMTIEIPPPVKNRDWMREGECEDDPEKGYRTEVDEDSIYTHAGSVFDLSNGQSADARDSSTCSGPQTL